MDFWKGMIVTKHHLGTGDIRNHIEITSIQLINDDTLVLTDGLKHKGSGAKDYLVTFSFTNGVGGYEMVISSDAEPTEEQAIDEAASMF